MGASNKYTADEQLEQIAFFWITLHDGDTPPLTVRLLSRHRDVYFDLGGGSRIPKISERKARSVAELRAAGVGIGRVLLAYDSSQAASDLLQGLLTMLDPDVPLGLVCPADTVALTGNGATPLQKDRRRAEKLGHELEVHTAGSSWAEEVVLIARQDNYDLIVLPLAGERIEGQSQPWDAARDEILRHAHCRVFLAAPPAIPRRTDEEPPVKQ